MAGTPGYSYIPELAGGAAQLGVVAWPSLPSTGSINTIEGRRQVNSAGGLSLDSVFNITDLVFLEAYKRVLRAFCGPCELAFGYAAGLQSAVPRWAPL